MDRRKFIQQSTNAALGISALPLLGATRPFKKYKLAIIGVGWWGMNILREAIAHQGSKVVAICDVDTRALKAAQEEIKKLNGDKPKAYPDYRELITKEKPDIVIIATPDHWHALPAIMAIEHGAHVYLEKPIGHTIMEGRAILNAARKYERTVQVDTHRRVSPHNMSGMDFLKQGKAGQISSVKAFVNYGGGPGKVVPNEEAPKELDWDMWCGPAPYTDYNPQIHPKGFRQFMDYANGTIGDWGIHWFDQVLWWTEEKYPKTIYSTGGRHVRKDNTTAPDTQYALYEFESFTLHWEHKLAAKNANESPDVGCYFYGTEGTFHMGWRDGWTFYPSKKGAEIIHVEPTLHKPDDQNIKELWADFIKSIEDKKRPTCDIEKGHLATNVSLLGVLSYKLGRSLKWDGEKEQIIDDPEANKLLAREYRGDWEYPVID
ncbi:MAG: Gfo/Idh/MocA family oxidoreductase [Saprospiraceae bacterium]